MTQQTTTPEPTATDPDNRFAAFTTAERHILNAALGGIVQDILAEAEEEGAIAAEDREEAAATLMLTAAMGHEVASLLDIPAPRLDLFEVTAAMIASGEYARTILEVQRDMARERQDELVAEAQRQMEEANREERWRLPSVEHDDPERIAELFIGRTVKKVADDTLELDDGTVLFVEANEGCGGCSNGHYRLTDLNGCENAITSAVVEDEPHADDDYDERHTYRLFVFADNQKINLATVDGTDGNGYYGTGFSIRVRRPVDDAPSGTLAGVDILPEDVGL